jgi:hypothetical protein
MTVHISTILSAQMGPMDTTLQGRGTRDWGGESLEKWPRSELGHDWKPLLVYKWLNCTPAVQSSFVGGVGYFNSQQGNNLINTVPVYHLKNQKNYVCYALKGMVDASWYSRQFTVSTFTGRSATSQVRKKLCPGQISSLLCTCLWGRPPTGL